MNILQHKKLFLTISSILVIAALAVSFIQGLNLGIDFEGGSLMEIEFAESVTKHDIEGKINTISNTHEVVGNARIQSADNNIFVIRTRELNDTNHSVVVEVLSSLEGYKELSFTRIGPVIGEQLRSKAVTSIIVAIVLIILYVAYAFRNIPSPLSSWYFGLIAVIALVHDVAITLGVFAVLQLEIDSFFITAMLTVLGYSVNDTIVVFDRVRETVVKKLESTFEKACQYSISSTIMRSINTSVTLLITLFALYFLAGPSIQNFILALIVGVSIGTYSSIFLATPLLVVLQPEAKTPAVVSKKKKKK